MQHARRPADWPHQIQEQILESYDFFTLCSLQAGQPRHMFSAGSADPQQHLLLMQQAYQQHKQQQQRTGFSPFSVAENQQLAQQSKPLARSSCPSLMLEPQESEDLQHEQLSLTTSSSWSNSSMCLSRYSCSTASMRSFTSGLHWQDQLSGTLQHQLSHQQQQQQLQQPLTEQRLKQQQQQQQQPYSHLQHMGLDLQADSRTPSCSPYSPCCSASSEYGDLCCCNVVACTRQASSLTSLGHSQDNLCGSSTRACSSGSSEEAAADIAEAAADLLCRTISCASSTWSNKSQHVASRPAPGGILGNGISWVMPQYGGREVLADYEFGQTLGCGTFGVTRLVTHRKTASLWACKTICKASIAASAAAQSDVQHEVAILRHLKGHNGIVQLKGVYEDERNIHLVMELCTGGDLLDYISRFGRLEEAEAADVASVMLSTLAHCHRLGVVHRDIKPENFLLGAPTLLSAPAGTAASVLKISDFGVSAFFQPGERFTEIVGTPFYMAPEVLERCYGQEADVWSVGVVVFLMLAGRLPFDGATDRQIIKAVLDSEPDFQHPAWHGISAAAKDCVGGMLVKDPRQRATVQQLLAHPWLAGRMRSSCCSNSGEARSEAFTDACSTATACGGRCCSDGSSMQTCSDCSSRQPLLRDSSTSSTATSSTAKGYGVSWATPCAVELASSPVREPRSSSPSPRRPQLSPLKHVRSRMCDEHSQV